MEVVHKLRSLTISDQIDHLTIRLLDYIIGANFAAAGETPNMIDVNDLRKGVTFELDGQLLRVIEYHHHKPGRGNAVIRTKVRNLRTGATFEKTFQSGDRVQDVRIEAREMQYLYHDGDFYTFMDTRSYEQIVMEPKLLDEAVHYLKDGMDVVVQSDAAVRGDTATGSNKLVTVETGYRVQVPLFVNEGDTIRIDTRSGEYVTRV
jgi:elongation factor P